MDGNSYAAHVGLGEYGNDTMYDVILQIVAGWKIADEKRMSYHRFL